MIEQSVIDNLKQSVKITDILYTRNYMPCNSTGRQYVYRSPLTDERSGSFFVDPEKNVFNDFSSGEKGDNIRLIRLLDKVDFLTAIRTLQYSEGIEIIPFSIEKATAQLLEPNQPKCEITDIKPLQHKSLIRYIESRAIPFSVAFPYVKEVHYKAKDSKFFGVGFQTDKGSFAIRAEKFKTWIGSSSITTIEIPDSTAINLFEGFFDFLSALTYFRVKQMRNTTIVLNSNSHLNHCLQRLKTASTVFTYLDKDGKGNNGGLQAMQRLRDAGCNIIDRSNLYEGYKDFNDRLRAL